MDPFRLTTELLFGFVFVFVGYGYVRRRDAVSRDLVLAFAGLGLTFVVDVWRRVAGSTPPPIGFVVAVLLLLQPLFVLHLVSLIRDVSRIVLVGATLLLLGSVAAAILFRSVPALPIVALGVFAGIEVLAAILLLIEARQRRGPGAVRLALAAVSTGLFAVALASAGVGAVQDELAANATVAALALALMAGTGWAGDAGQRDGRICPAGDRDGGRAGGNDLGRARSSGRDGPRRHRVGRRSIARRDGSGRGVVG
jgi:hypothetical protein